jgi:hypothetical protein
VKYSRAWHIWTDESGVLVRHGSRRITVGVRHDGAVYLTREDEMTGEIDRTKLPASKLSDVITNDPVKSILETLDADGRELLIRHIGFSLEASKVIGNYDA